MTRFLLAAFTAFALTLNAFAADPPAPDPYGYLEDATSAQAQAFLREQAQRTRAALDRIPGRDAMLARIHALGEGAAQVTAVAMDARRVFYLKLAPRAAAPVLCMRDGVTGPEHVLVDPERFRHDEARASIDWFVPSPDGRHVAFGVSIGGSEDAVLRVLDVDALRVLPFEIDRARFNSGLAWHPDGKSFYYARIPEANTGVRLYANVRVYRHVLGRETARDEIVFGSGVGGARDVPEFVYPSLHIPHEGAFAYAIARDGVRNEIAVHVASLRDLAAGKPRWRKIVGYEDEVTQVEGWRDELFVLSHRNAPRYRVLRVKATGDMRGARTVVPEGDTVIEKMGLARDALYLRTMVAGVDRLERMGLGLLGGKSTEFIRTPFDNAISQLVTDPRVNGAILRLQGWIDAPKVVQVLAKSGDIVETPIQPPTPADYSGMDEVRLYAPSHDGTKIPVTMFYRKTTQLNRVNPTLLMGYGSYGTTYAPSFDPARLAWLERGGVIAVAHVRGGGEYGETWHQAGRRAAKLNTILDFIAVSEFLVSYGFTNPAKLAIEGTSAGGIPVGGALVRRPDLYAAVVARVPVMDMLNYEKMPGGPANIPEFGSASTPDGLEALRIISAYQQVKDGTPYPGVLLTAGLDDPRVMPWQAAKMAARLQAASTSGKPVLLRIDMDSGHGTGTMREQRESELADIYSFLLWQMGDPNFQPPAVAAPAASEPAPSAPAPSAPQKESTAVPR